MFRYTKKNHLMIPVLLFISLIVYGQSYSADTDLNAWQVISGGGTNASSPDYILMGTINQTSVGSLSAEGYRLESGYWQDVIGLAPCNCTPGDPNNNGAFELVDVMYLINYVYRNGQAPQPQTICAGDPRVDCRINIIDITFMIGYLYQGGPAPVSCRDWTEVCGSK